MKKIYSYEEYCLNEGLMDKLSSIVRKYPIMSAMALATLLNSISSCKKYPDPVFCADRTGLPQGVLIDKQTKAIVEISESEYLVKKRRIFPDNQIAKH